MLILRTRPHSSSEVMHHCLDAWFLLQQNFETHDRVGQMHQFTRRLCWRLTIIGMNWWASFNVLMTFSIIHMAEGALLIDTSCAVQVVIILLILFSHLFTFPSMSPLFTCLEYYKLCVPLLTLSKRNSWIWLLHVIFWRVCCVNIWSTWKVFFNKNKSMRVECCAWGQLGHDIV